MRSVSAAALPAVCQAPSRLVVETIVPDFAKVQIGSTNIGDIEAATSKVEPALFLEARLYIGGRAPLRTLRSQP